MCKKVFSLCIVLVAVVMGALAVSLPMNDLVVVVVISKFFEVMIPVLAVGALLKYLFHWCDK